MYGSYLCWPALACLPYKFDFIVSYSVKASSNFNITVLTYVLEVGCNKLKSIVSKINPINVVM